MIKKSKKVFKIIVGSTLLFTTVLTPMSELVSNSDRVLASTIKNKEMSQVENPDLTGINKKLGDDQKQFKTNTDSLTELYNKFIADNNIENVEEQQEVISSIQQQMKLADTFVTDIEEFISENPKSTDYPNLVDNLKEYSSELSTYKEELSKVLDNLQTVIKKNNDASEDYKKLSLAYSDLIASYNDMTSPGSASPVQGSLNNYILDVYNSLNTYIDGKGFKSQTIPSENLGIYKNNSEKYVQKLSSYLIQLKEFNSKYSNLNSETSAENLDLYNSAVVNFEQSKSDISKMNDALEKAKQTYSDAQNNYNNYINSDTAYLDFYNDSGSSSFFQSMFTQFTSVNRIFDTDLTKQMNETSPLGWSSGLESQVVSDFLNGTYPIVDGTFSAPTGWTSSFNNWAQGYSQVGTSVDNVVNSYNATEAVTSGILSKQTYSSYSWPGIGTKQFDLFKQLNTNMKNFKQNPKGPSGSGISIGYGLPSYQTIWKAYSEDKTTGEKTNIDNPIPTNLDYPSLDSLQQNILNLQKIYGRSDNSFEGVDPDSSRQDEIYTVTPSTVNNWNESLKFIQDNWQAKYIDIYTTISDLLSTYNSSAMKSADAHKFVDGWNNNVVPKLYSAYSLVYGSYENYTDAVYGYHFINDVNSLSAQQLSEKYGYRYLLLGMTQVLRGSYANTVQLEPTPTTIVYKEWGEFSATGDLPRGFEMEYVTVKANTPQEVLEPDAVAKTTDVQVPPHSAILEKFDENLPTPPKLLLDYDPPFNVVMPYTGTHGNYMNLILSFGAISILLGSVVIVIRKKHI